MNEAFVQVVRIIEQLKTRIDQLECVVERERCVELSDWRFVAETWTYVSGNQISGRGDRRYPIGTKLRLLQKRAYTNDPISGTNVVLMMSNTSGFVVGNVVSVSSSAGTETTTITNVLAGVSITVAALSLDHTMINPLVSATKYFYVVGSQYASTNTTLTLAGDVLGTGTIEQVYVSSAFSPSGFPQWFSYVPQWSATITPPSLGNGTLVGRFAIVGRLEVVCIAVTMGSTTTFGAGSWTFTLPVAVGGTSIGSAVLHDVSAVRWYLGAGYPVSESAISVATNSATSLVASSSPFTWASGDWLRIQIALEI